MDMDKIPEFTILSADQCFGENRLKLFDEIGLLAELTDAAAINCRRKRR